MTLNPPSFPFLSYNAWLSIYFYLLTCRQWSANDVATWVESAAHVVAGLAGVGTAVAAWRLDLYNAANLWCWIAPLPADCDTTDDLECTRGENAYIYRWAFYFIPLWTCIVTACIAITLVYRTVHRLEKHTTTIVLRQSMVASQQLPNLQLHDSRNNISLQSSSNHLHADAYSWNSNQSERANDSSMGDGNSTNHDDGGATSTNADDIASNLADATLSHCDDLDDDEQDTAPAEQAVTTTASNTKSNAQQILAQSLWYLAAFYVTHLFSTVNRALQLTVGHTYFELLVLHAWFDPLQGWLNFLVYRRPMYLRYRRAASGIGRWRRYMGRR